MADLIENAANILNNPSATPDAVRQAASDLLKAVQQLQSAVNSLSTQYTTHTHNFAWSNAGEQGENATAIGVAIPDRANSTGIGFGANVPVGAKIGLTRARKG